MHVQGTAPLAGGYATRNTLVALELLAVRPRSTPELAVELGVDVRSARLLLRRLMVEGFVVQESGYRRRYRLTLRVVAVAGRVLSRSVLPSLALPVLEQLAVACGATAHLWVTGGASTCCVAHATCDRPGDMSVRVDERESRDPRSDASPDEETASGELQPRDVERAVVWVADVVELGRPVACVALTGAGDLGDGSAVREAADRVSGLLAGVRRST